MQIYYNICYMGKEDILDNKEEEAPVENEVVQPEVVTKNDYVIELPPEEKPEPVEVEPNRKAHWSMRIAAGLIDLGLMFLATLGLYQLILISPIANGLNATKADVVEVVDMYKITPVLAGSDETIGYKVYEDESAFDDPKYKDYQIYPRNHLADKYYKVIEFESSTDELKAAFDKAVKNDEKYKALIFNYQLIDYGLVMLAGGVSELVFMLVIPLTNKRRASIGKLLAGTQVINSKYLVPAKWYQMVGRFIWQLIFESAIPYLFLSSSIWTMLVVPPVLFIITFTNKDGRTLHDFIARTKVIDKRTFKQLSEL